MTVAKLITLLQKHDPNRLVVMSKDAEGNGFSPLSAIEAVAYRADTTWSGEIGLEELTPSLKKAGYTEDDILSDGKPALVLIPIN